LFAGPGGAGDVEVVAVAAAGDAVAAGWSSASSSSLVDASWRGCRASGRALTSAEHSAHFALIFDVEIHRIGWHCWSSSALKPLRQFTDL